MFAPVVRSPYNYDQEAVSVETGLHCEDPSLAIQSALEESDINTIVKRFGLTGQLPDDIKLPQYADYVGISDFHSAMNVVREAGEAFSSLPADVRYKFHNDPQEFLQFVSTEGNLEELRKMGLAKPAEPSIVAPAVVAPVGAPAVEERSDGTGKAVGDKAKG